MSEVKLAVQKTSLPDKDLLLEMRQKSRLEQHHMILEEFRNVAYHCREKMN